MEAIDSVSEPESGRRLFLRRAAGAGLIGAGVNLLSSGMTLAQSPGDALKVALPPLQAPTEAPEPTPEPGDPPSQRVGFALVGLGHLALNQLLPAFAKTRYCKPVALVSGDRAKALKIAAQHGIDEGSIYDYRGFDRIADDPAVQVVYIVLPNAMHAEYTVRAAQAGKHVLCEKPMATSSADCLRMIDACKRAGRQLMIAYRSQYEPHNLAIQKMVRDQRLGALKEFASSNGQVAGDPTQWRLKRALAGGGPLPDVGVYCINGVRFLTGEEPSAVWGDVTMNPNDPRFREVEESVRFVLRFPSGLTATCHASYNTHHSQYLRLMGTDAWAELDPAYAYRGQKLRTSRLVDEKETVQEPAIADVDQFAKEMDHFAERVRANRRPYSTGEDGLQDQRVIDAIYESAKSGRWIGLAQPEGPVRGEPPAQSSS